MHALHSRHKVNRPQYGPPFGPQTVHKVQAAHPVFLAELGQITAKAPLLNFKIQELEPVAQAPISNQLLHLGQQQTALGGGRPVPPAP